MEFLKRASAMVERRMGPESLFAPARYVEGPAGCFFYHTMDLPGFGVQDGGWDLRGRFLDYIGRVDLNGKRVLDVGSASGFLTFEAERYGACEVVSFDLDSARRQTLLPFADSDYVLDHATWCHRQTEAFKTWQNAYWLAHRLLRSQAKTFHGDIYHIPPELGQFDVIIVGAILEHLSDPIQALTSLGRLAKDIIVINTDYFDSPERVALFQGRADQPGNSFTFWKYSIALYDEYMKIMGFHALPHHIDVFPGSRPAPEAPRPMLERAALVYQKAS